MYRDGDHGAVAELPAPDPVGRGAGGRREARGAVPQAALLPRPGLRRGAGAGSIREGHQEREQGDDDDDDDFDRYMDGFEEDCTGDEPAG